jgi:proteasome lid subunit RPN8/RPN11
MRKGTFQKIIQYVDHSIDVEQSLLFDMNDNGDLRLMNKTVSVSSEEVDIPDEYFEKLFNCEGIPVDVHTHPNYNCIPSVLDIAFYLSNEAIREAYIIGGSHYFHISFPAHRKFVPPSFVEQEYLRIMNEMVKKFDFDSVPESMATEVSLRLMDAFGIMEYEIRGFVVQERNDIFVESI